MKNTEPALEVGVNLGGWLSQYPAFDRGHFDTFITSADIRQIAAWGMDHVRVPIDYPVLEADEQPLVYREEGWAYIDKCLEWCGASDLRVILDLHKAPGFAFDQVASATLFNDTLMQHRFVALWETIARRYRGIRETLAFELLNEIVLPTSDPWNRLARQTIAAIRALDPDRLIVVGGNYYNSATTLSELDLPKDPRLLYTFHFYHPLIFTHQKAHWIPALVGYNQTIEYPGECPGWKEFAAQHAGQASFPNSPVEPFISRESLCQAIQPALDFMQHTGLGLYCGEFGVIDRAPRASALRWHRDLVDILREHGIRHAVWSYKQMDFGLVDATGQVIDAELVKIVSAR